MKMKYLPLGITLLSIFNLANCLNQKPDSTLLTVSYCACRCCEYNPEDCMLYPTIPDDYECREGMCNKRFCETWEKAKCSTDCFCEKCEDMISKTDYRCLGFTGVPFSCSCSQQDIQCPGPTEQQPPALSNTIGFYLNIMEEQKECIIPCICSECQDVIPPQLYGDCLRNGKPGKECQCGRAGCPNKGALEALKKFAMGELTEEMEARLKNKQSLSPEQERETQCRMQCFCNKCREVNEDMIKLCRPIQEKQLENCECDKNINCPEDLEITPESQCKLYCFCDACMSDNRMPKQMVYSCTGVTTQGQACFCKEEDKDCNILDRVWGKDEL